MTKLVLHLVVAGLLVAVGQRAHWPWWSTLGAVALGALAVHLFYERFMVGPTRHLGVVPIANDDPLMVDAFAEAKRTWPHFLGLYAQHPNGSMVKYRIHTKSGDVENVWGDLVELGSENATVYLRTPPVGDADIPARRMVIQLADVVDWQVMVADGSLRGGFTQQAAFHIIERETGTLPPRLAEQRERYRPIFEQAA